MADRQTRWEVKNENSFASVLVNLPPNSAVHCEADALVTMSETVDVRGVLSGGLFAGLARTFLTKESFFTTKVQNESSYAAGNVLIAPADPGGITLYRIFPGEDLSLTSGAYLAADDGVKIESSMQTQFGNSLLSGTGFFLLRASGRGTIAISAFGSIHKYLLSAGERRKVDNGHLVAWTASMKFKMTLASSRSGIFGSMTSGEGLMCEFEGPGFLFVQSHKPKMDDEQNAKSRKYNGEGVLAVVIFLIILVVFIIVFVIINWAVFTGNTEFSGSFGSDQQRYRGIVTREYEL